MSSHVSQLSNEIANVEALLGFSTNGYWLNQNLLYLKLVTRDPDDEYSAIKYIPKPYGVDFGLNGEFSHTRILYNHILYPGSLMGRGQ
jgi:hypothetical protein